MSGLPVVDGPAVNSVGKGLLEVDYCRSADSNFDELPLVDEDLVVVSSSLCEDLCSKGGLEAVALSGFGPEGLGIQFDFVTSFLRVPVKKC